MITTFLKRSKALSWVLALALVTPAMGQTAPPAPPPAPPADAAAPAFTAEQLEQIAAPVALYPDPLLAQVLMASTYPLEVVQAARFVKDHKDLTGDKLDEALKDQTWDDSVKSLVSFPQVLSLMDGKLDWTQQLGDATIGQQKELMEAIQRLRARAQAQGNLKSTSEQTVTVEPAAAPGPGQAVPAQQTIVIQPANPEVVYVPSYNPTVVYGAWPYPAYPPAYPYPPGYAFGGALLSFGVGMAVGGALWGNCNWGGGNVDVNVNRNANFSKNVNRANISNDRVNQYRQGQGQGGNRNQWNHNPQHRQGVQYRDQASQQKYNRGSNSQAVQSRENFRGRADQGRQDLSRGGGGQGFGGAGQRPGGAGGQGFGGASAGQRPAGGGGQGFGGAGQRPGGGGREAGAFQGMGGGSGGNVRADSNRGASSRQSMGASRGGGSVSRPSGGGGASRPSGGGGASRGGGGGSRGGGRR